MFQAPTRRQLKGWGDPRSWSLASQLALSFGALVTAVLALLAWMVTRSAEPTVIEKAGGTYQAVAGGVNDLLMLYLGDRVGEVQVLQQSPVIRALVDAGNASYPADPEQAAESIRELDRAWRSATPDHPLIRQVIDREINSAAAELTDFLLGFPAHSELILTDRLGATVAASGRLTDYDQSDEEWWQTAWAGGEGRVYLSQPTFDESAGVIAILLASPVLGSDGAPIGILRSTLAVDQMYALLSDAASARNYDIDLIDSNGVRLFDSALGISRVGTPPSDEFLSIIHGLDEGFGETEGVHFAPTIYGFAALHSDAVGPYDQQLVRAVDDLGWTTVVHRDRKSLFEPVAEFQGLMTWVTLVAAFAFGLAAYAISRSITSPLRRLTAAAARLTTAEASEQIDVVGNRELAELTRAFNHMSQQLHETLEQMRQQIEERRRAEETAQESAARLKGTMDTMQEGAQIIDPEWRYVYVNDAVAEQGRRPTDELLGRTMMEVYPGIEDTEMFRQLQRCLETGKSHIMENEFTFPDGSVGWFDLRIQRVPEGVFILSTEITERKQVERQMRQLNEQLERRVKERTAELEAANRELEAFAYSVSHDLRAPLRGIDGFTQALVEDHGDQLDDQARSYTRRVRAAAQRMGRLIDDLLQLSRVTRAGMSRENVDLSDLAHETVGVLRESEPDRQVEFVIDEQLRCHGDGSLMRVALDNLLENAWKFTSREPQARIQVGREHSNGQAAFYVRDNGIGFDMEYAEKLFGEFQRLHSAADFPGTGVGLAIVRRIIRRHGGEVWAEAAVGEGATFYFTLPEGGDATKEEGQMLETAR